MVRVRVRVGDSSGYYHTKVGSGDPNRLRRTRTPNSDVQRLTRGGGDPENWSLDASDIRAPDLLTHYPRLRGPARRKRDA